MDPLCPVFTLASPLALNIACHGILQLILDIYIVIARGEAPWRSVSFLDCSNKLYRNGLSMNILILSGSPRKGGNTDLLVDAFVKGASPKHHVEVVSVHDYKINPCIGCNSCFAREDHACCQKDDMQIVYEKMTKAEMLVIASPVYFYGLSAQLKAVIDRFHNPIRDTFHIHKMALLLVGAASLPELFDSIVAQYELCLKFFKLKDMGRVLVRSAKDKGDVKNGDSLKQAFELGRSF